MESVSEKLKESLEFESLLNKYQDIFVGPDCKLGLTNLTEHSIDTGNHLPIKQRFRKLPIAQREAVEKELDKLEKQGLIKPSDSPWTASLVIVIKKDGSLRVCADFRAINNISRKSAVVLPNTKDCLASLDGAKYFCTMDLASGYHQIPMKKEDKCETTFYTRRGLMQCTVMPSFGLTGAPSTFENLIEKVMRGLQWETSVL